MLLVNTVTSAELVHRSLRSYLIGVVLSGYILLLTYTHILVTVIRRSSVTTLDNSLH